MSLEDEHSSEGGWWGVFLVQVQKKTVLVLITLRGNGIIQ